MYRAMLGSPPCLRTKAGFRIRILLFLLFLAAAGGFFSAAPVSVHADPVEITQGSLEWGLRTSFRNYAGGGEPSAGATLVDSENPYSSFVWPVVSGSYDPATKALTIQFGGSVHFAAHCEFDPCALEMTVANPRIEITPEEAVLYADVVSRDFNTQVLIDYANVRFAELDAAATTPLVEPGTTAWSQVPAVLTAQGVPAFAGFYAAGSTLDALTFRYEGPGGNPWVEEWTAPGSPLFTEIDSIEVSSWIPGWIAVDEEAGLIHAYDFSGFRAVDLQTGADVGTRYATANQVRNLGFSPTAFAMGYDRVNKVIIAPISGALLAIQWNSGTESYDVTTLLTAANMREAAVSPDGSKVVVRRTASASATSALTYITFERQFDGSYSQLATYAAPTGISTSIKSMAINDDGVIFLARTTGLAAAAVPTEGGSLTVSDIADTAGAIRVAAVADGTIVFSAASPNRLLSVTKVTGSYLVTGSADMGLTPVAHIGLAISPVDNAVFLSSTSQVVKVVEANKVIASVTSAWTYDHSIATGTSGRLYLQEDARIRTFALTSISPTITEQPQNETVVLQAGSATAVFTAAAEGAPAPSVQWQQRSPGSQMFVNIEGATSESLTLTVDPPEMHGTTYRAVFSNTAGSIASQGATLTVASAPTIIAQPSNISVQDGGNALFLVGPGGVPAPEVQWQRFDNGSWVEIEGATDGFLTIEQVTLQMSLTKYRAKLTNIAGSAYSDIVTLTVTEGEPEPGTDASQTITTTIVSTGGLSISVGSTQVALPTPVLNGASDALVSSGALNPVTVTDQRSANPGWNLNGQVSAFTSTDNSFGGEHLGWTPEVVSQSGSQNVSAGAAVAPGGSLSTGAGLASAPAGAGVGTAVVGAGLELSVPTTTAPGDYSATLTLTVI